MKLSKSENTYLETVQQTPGLLDTYLEEHSGDPELIAESLAIDFMEDAAKLLKEKGISRSDLSGLMNVSRGYVTKLLNSPPNLTLMSVARLSVALNATPYIGLMEKEPIGFEIKLANAGVEYIVSGIASGKMIPQPTMVDIAGVASDIMSIPDGVLSINASGHQLQPVTERFALASTANNKGVLINA